MKKIDLYSLYESYLDSRLRLTWFERKSEILFSTVSEQGPFYTLTSMKWYDKKVYAQFVMRKILLEQFTTRSFRLNASIPLSVKFDNELNTYQNTVSIHQITEKGLLLKVSDKNFKNKIQYSVILDFQIPVTPYLVTKNLGFDETWQYLNTQSMVNENQFKSFKLEAKILNLHGNFTNIQRSTDKEFYIFTKYEDFKASGHNHQLFDIFLPLVMKTKQYLAKDLEMIKTGKLAA
jgi:hypothetical protein